MKESPEAVAAGSVPPLPVPARLERLVRLLDGAVRIPGTQIRFGLDVVLGLVPGIGDFVGLALGLPVLALAVRRRRRLRVLLLMATNLLLDAVIGTIPIAGNLFDLFWRAHDKNLRLLREPEAVGEILREARWKVGLLLLAALVLVALLIWLIILSALVYLKLLTTLGTWV